VTPLVSAIIPVRDGERYLEDAIRSVLDQSFDEFELIVVDDGSEDGTADVIRSMGGAVRAIRQDPTGVGAALNRGVRASRGAFIAFLDADDLWTRRKLELQVAVLAGDPEIDLAFGHMRHFHSRDLSDEQRALLACPPDAMPGLSKDTMLIRRESFTHVGPFENAFRVGEFVDWYARATECGLAAEMLPDVLALRRVHAGNTTLLHPEARLDYARIARAALHRRRAR
jgi:glycosyltransferase involved in cell wall biosynthesis